MQVGSERKAFRWEQDCLADDPFAGDFGDGEVALSDKMVTNRKGGTCHTCAGSCEPGTRNRVMVERADGELVTYRWCQSCCFAMAVYDRRPSIAEARFELGNQRRSNPQGPPPMQVNREEAEAAWRKGRPLPGWTVLTEEVPGVPDEDAFFIYKFGTGKLWRGETKSAGEAWAAENGVEIHTFEHFEP